MIVIYAEKADAANKIAAALGTFTIGNGKQINFGNLKANEKAVKSHQSSKGYLEIKYLGDDCYVTWGYGHMCEIFNAVDYDPGYKSWRNLPVPFIPEQYKLKKRDGYNATRNKEQMKVIKELFGKAKFIINATDFDREGEVIFAYIYEFLKCKTPYKRAHFSSQTQQGIQDGFKKLKESAEVKPIEMAGRGRSVADWVVGANLTAQMSLKFPGNGVLSVGRVQTPTLNMIVERELAIRNFKSEPFWTVNALFTTDKQEQYKGEHTAKRFTIKAEAEKVLSATAGKKGTVAKVDSKRTKKEAPNLYSLSSLQMDANSQFGMTLQQTLEAAQKLYDGGYTTYPRTDSQFLTDDMEPVVMDVLDALEGTPQYGKYLKGKPRAISNKKKYFDSSKVTSHYAIIPTGSLPGAMSAHESNVFDLICKSVIRMTYPAAEIENTTVITEVNNEPFESKGTVVVAPGWMAVEAKIKEELLPALKVGQVVDGKYEIKKGKTEPPKRFTDKTLVAAMKAAGKELDDDELKKIMADPSVNGIGTEATRANIIETLISREYIERQAKSIAATDKGINMIAMLPCQALKSPELTALWEKQLSDIAAAKANYNSFVKDVEKQTGIWCEEITALTGVANQTAQQGAQGQKPQTAGNSLSSTGLICPACGEVVRKLNWGWGCNGYSKGCKFSISGTICGKKLSDSQVAAIINNGKSAVIKGFKSKAGKSFEARLMLVGNKVEFSFEKNWEGVRQ